MPKEVRMLERQFNCCRGKRVKGTRQAAGHSTIYKIGIEEAEPHSFLSFLRHWTLVIRHFLDMLASHRSA
jgi:hypothetical protein